MDPHGPTNLDDLIDVQEPDKKPKVQLRCETKDCKRVHLTETRCNQCRNAMNDVYRAIMETLEQPGILRPINPLYGKPRHIGPIEETRTCGSCNKVSILKGHPAMFKCDCSETKDTPQDHTDKEPTGEQ